MRWTHGRVARDVGERADLSVDSVQGPRKQS